MNTSQKALVNMLSAYIHKSETDLYPLNELDWNEIYEEAEAHEVLSLVYPIVKKINSSREIPNNIIDKWTKDTIITAIHQTQHINQMKTVFAAFNKAGIQVIALKGLVLRELYPNPEFRTMSDSDLLIKKDQIDIAENVLLSLGYSKYSSIDYESCFTHNSALSIDLHWALSNKEHLKNISPFEDSLWKNLRPYSFNGIEINALSLEYEFIYLFIHIASHMIKSGFGLRQLCDITMFTKDKGALLDWELVYGLGEACKLNKFINTILNICNNFFGLRVPDDYKTEYWDSIEYINILANEIFKNGVHGKRDDVRVLSNRMFNHSLQSNGDANKFVLILRYLFPSINKLDKRYAYALKYPSLLPFAWIHRLVYETLVNCIPRIKEFMKLGSTASLVKNRIELIEWLQLH